MLTKTLVRALLASAIISSASTAEKIEIPQEAANAAPEKPRVFRLDEPPYQNEDQELQVRYRWELEEQPAQAVAVPMPSDYPMESFGETSVAAPAIVPEPGTMILLGTGLALLAARRLRQLT